jgi:hypothetical protein
MSYWSTTTTGDFWGTQLSMVLSSRFRSALLLFFLSRHLWHSKLKRSFESVPKLKVGTELIDCIILIMCCLGCKVQVNIIVISVVRWVLKLKKWRWQLYLALPMWMYGWSQWWTSIYFWMTFVFSARHVLKWIIFRPPPLPNVFCIQTWGFLSLISQTAA